MFLLDIPFQCTDSDCNQLISMYQTNFNKINDLDLINSINQMLQILSTIDQYKLGLIANIMYNIAQRNNATEQVSLVLSYMQLFDQILNQPLAIIQSTQNIFQSSNMLASAIETLFYKIILTNESIINVKFNNFLIKSSLIRNQSINLSDYGTDDQSGYFNPIIINNLIQSDLLLLKPIKLNFIKYLNSKLFTTNNVLNTDNYSCDTSQSYINSNIMAIHPLNQDVNLNDSNLITTLFRKQKLNCSGISVKYDCVYWDFNLTRWSTYGCWHDYKLINNSLYHQCNCSHTTSFGLLMTIDTYPYCDWCETTLKVLSCIGVFLSIIGLLITIFYDICM